MGSKLHSGYKIHKELISSCLVLLKHDITDYLILISCLLLYKSHNCRRRFNKKIWQFKIMLLAAVNTCCSSTQRFSGPDRWPLCSTPLHICSSLPSCDCSLKIQYWIVHRVYTQTHCGYNKTGFSKTFLNGCCGTNTITLADGQSVSIFTMFGVLYKIYCYISAFILFAKTPIFFFQYIDTLHHLDFSQNYKNSFN